MTNRCGAALALAVVCLAQLAAAQNFPESGSGVYTCVDAQGRKLTSDRPIPECSDREQRILNPSGTVRAVVGPTLTAAERVKQDARERQEQDARNRQQEEKRRDRALLARYPTRASHDRERADSLAQIDDSAAAAKLRLQELATQRQKIDVELEFYKKDANKAPEYLRRQLDENIQNSAAQQKFLKEQEEEALRVNQRFDEELARLRQLWLNYAPR